MGCTKPAVLHRQLWIPEDGSFSVDVPLPPRVYQLGAGATLYTFPSPDNHARGPLLEVEVQVKSPYAPQEGTDAYYDMMERAYQGERGAALSAVAVSNNGYRGRQFEITAGARSPVVVQVYSTEHRIYHLEWNPTIANAGATANSFVMPQGASQP